MKVESGIRAETDRADKVAGGLGGEGGVVARGAPVTASPCPRPSTAPAEGAVSRRTATRDLDPLSVRIPATARRVRCADCGGDLLAAGPTGHVGDAPVCDRCLLERCEALGMVLALVSVTRSFANMPDEPPEATHEALIELAAFAQVYELVAAREAPPRPFSALGGADA